MKTHPEKWYIQVTPENHEEVKAWWLKQVEKSGWVGRNLYNSYLILSKHPWDGSFYWSDGGFSFKKAFPSYQEITIEQFRQITNTNNMNTLPTNWCIEATEENFAELYPWWRANASEYFKVFAIGFTLMSSHPDGSCYFSNCEEQCVKSYPNYQPITLEQFRAITNPLPEHWYIEVTEENIEELNRWRLSKRTIDAQRWDSRFVPGATLLSKHPEDDGSYFWLKHSTPTVECKYPEYKPITLEQFRQITNSTPTQKPMSKTIQISRTLLNEYFDAATTPQKEYLSKHFKLDGTTTEEAIRGLYELACGGWKPKIKANHPECFPEESKYFDFSKHTNLHGYHNIVSSDVAHSLGLCRNFIQVRNSDTENSDRSFYLTSDYNWELVKDDGAMVLIPTKKVK